MAFLQKPMMKAPMAAPMPAAQDQDQGPAEGDEAGEIAQIKQRLDALEQEVAALKGEDQQEQAPANAPGKSWHSSNLNL